LRNKNQTLSFSSSEIKLHHLETLVSKEKKWVEESLAQIQFVFAEELNLSVLPDWLQKCHRIKLLDLASNSISDAPAIHRMSHLNELLLSNNRLQEIDCSELIQLQRLNISDNHL
jgi:Leucine-rich repeat (LRR) protein